MLKHKFHLFHPGTSEAEKDRLFVRVLRQALRVSARSIEGGMRLAILLERRAPLQRITSLRQLLAQEKEARKPLERRIRKALRLQDIVLTTHVQHLPHPLLNPSILWSASAKRRGQSIEVFSRDSLMNCTRYGFTTEYDVRRMVLWLLANKPARRRPLPP